MRLWVQRGRQQVGRTLRRWMHDVNQASRAGRNRLDQCRCAAAGGCGFESRYWTFERRETRDSRERPALFIRAARLPADDSQENKP